MHIEHDFSYYINKTEGSRMDKVMENIHTKEDLLAMVPTPIKQKLYDYGDVWSYLYIYDNHAIACESKW